MNIHFHFTEATIGLTNRRDLKVFLKGLFQQEGVRLVSLNCIFCSDEYLLNINRRFLKHDYYTDIITFNLSAGQGRIEGELYISTDRIRDNAQKLGVTLKEELHRVIFHGALHLCGYKDKTAAEIIRMRAKENEYLNRYLP